MQHFFNIVKYVFLWLLRAIAAETSSGASVFWSIIPAKKWEMLIC
jgi:hypothetical protein